MLESVRAFNLAAGHRPDELVAMKDKGAVLVPYTGNFIPPELIRACGAEPYPEWRGGDPELPDAMLDESIRFLNPYTRSTSGAYRLGMAPVIESSDLLAWTASDCHNQRMGEMMESYGLNVMKVGIPTDWKNASSFRYYRDAIDRLVGRIVAVGGHAPAHDELACQIEKGNEIRALLRKVSDLRKAENPVIGFEEYIQVNHDTAICDPDTAIDYLKKVLAECEGAASKFKPQPIRLLLIGHTVAYGDYTVIREIEKDDAVIETQILDEGLIWDDIDVSTEGDLTENLLRASYLDRLPPSIFQPSWEQRMDAVVDTVRERCLDGVIFYELLYDEIYDMEYTCLAKRLAKEGIPLQCITSSYEYSREAILPLQTRRDSFIGQLKSARKGA